MLDLVKVDVYGQQMPINQVGSITIPEPRIINIQVWDQNNVSLVDAAIKKSELGLNPQIDGQLIRLPVPELNEERRAELKKMIKSMGEKCKVSVRNIRREANEVLKKLLRNKEVSEDEEKFHEKNIQNITDKQISIIEDKVVGKRKRNYENMNPINHVAIIMDGNGRWGLKHKNSRNAGHKEGLKTVEEIIQETIKHNIPYLTLYVFSTENWKRPKKEINYLFNLLEKYLLNKLDKLHKKNIKLKIIGEKKFSSKLNKLLEIAEKKTYLNKQIQLNLAINYGSKNEIINACKNLNKTKKRINEKNFSMYLETYNIPDPDLLIRTGNTKRLSNFLLWQLAYSEIFFVKKLWPEFNKIDYRKIISIFQNIKRNFGKI
jgi:undecaprenyl diphosphate synthase